MKEWQLSPVLHTLGPQASHLKEMEKYKMIRVVKLTVLITPKTKINMVMRPVTMLATMQFLTVMIAPMTTMIAGTCVNEPTDTPRHNGPIRLQDIIQT